MAAKRDGVLRVLESFFENHAPFLKQKKAALALAVSGGPDSMALAFLLSKLAVRQKNLTVHALTVDHGLRPESWQEAESVSGWLRGWPYLRHTVLRWNHQRGGPPQRAVMERARAARYALMMEYCQNHNVPALCLAHHRDDQAETLLFRLAKGSGLDGLAGMAPAVEHETGVMLLRPFLAVGKDDLLALCKSEHIPFISDPSNENAAYARPRLRQSIDVLAREGLTAERLSHTAQRMLRARQALESLSKKTLDGVLLKKETKRIVLKKDLLLKQPEEIVLRVVGLALANFQNKKPYPVRLERLEDLVHDLMAPSSFRRRTLGGVIIGRDDRKGEIVFRKEQTR